MHFDTKREGFVLPTDTLYASMAPGDSVDLGVSARRV